jgi:SagB-type dehydrogenase family enzyme
LIKPFTLKSSNHVLTMSQLSDTVLAYHQRTKHSLQRYAKGPETIDWEDQPDQFRRFTGCQQISLPKPGANLAPLFAELDNPAVIKTSPIDLTHVGLLFELAFGLSAWKQFGPSKWSLRCNPSSGNLHPTEAYLINTGADFIAPGVYHYLSHDHVLEQRCHFSAALPEPAILIGLSSVHWREAWKYGERAFRYCQHDIGHALGALRYAAAALGWSVELLADWSDEDLGKLLGINRTDDFKAMEHETPDLLCRIHANNKQTALSTNDLLAAAESGGWTGKADSLRAYHFYKWKVIDEVSQAAIKPRTEEPNWQADQQALPPSACTQTATQIIRQRRSAQQFDGKMASMASADFYRMLGALMPTSPTFKLWHWPPKVHLFIFVHRVAGLAPGIYSLPRSIDSLDVLKAATLPEFSWLKVTEALPLYQLHAGDCRQVAKTLSCHQPIASDSAFSLAMVAEFSTEVTEQAWRYRRLFWECGLIGQVLYLEAEAAGIRGTGIGCYFDDSVHKLLGFKDDKFQSLYHFTVGKPLEDSRLQSFPAYEHLG